MFSRYRTYSKELVITEVPSVKKLEETYQNHKPEGVKDFIVTTLLHRFAMRKLRSGFINEPGIYKLSVTVKLPIMFWHIVRYRIERL